MNRMNLKLHNDIARPRLQLDALDAWSSGSGRQADTVTDGLPLWNMEAA